jgi:hypothetical protein
VVLRPIELEQGFEEEDVPSVLKRQSRLHAGVALQLASTTTVAAAYPT